MSDLAPQIPKTEALQEQSARKPPGKVFKKCKSATFQIDGATYTIGKIFSIIYNIIFTMATSLSNIQSM